MERWRLNEVGQQSRCSLCEPQCHRNQGVQHGATQRSHRYSWTVSGFRVVTDRLRLGLCSQQYVGSAQAWRAFTALL